MITNTKGITKILYETRSILPDIKRAIYQDKYFDDR